jgi:hypothetical protein
MYAKAALFYKSIPKSQSDAILPECMRSMMMDWCGGGCRKWEAWEIASARPLPIELCNNNRDFVTQIFHKKYQVDSTIKINEYTFVSSLPIGSLISYPSQATNCTDNTSKLANQPALSCYSPACSSGCSCCVPPG